MAAPQAKTVLKHESCSQSHLGECRSGKEKEALQRGDIGAISPKAHMRS